MKLTIAAIFILLATIVLTYMNMWQIKNVDTQGKILNGPLLRFLIWYGLIIFFLVNPMIVLSYRYYFSCFKEFMVPQLLYFAATIISPLILAWLVSSETPSKGVLAGTFFAVISVLCVVFWK
jgi:hypothetical protein